MSDDKIHIPSDELVECPACGLPAEITDRFVLDGVPCPVEHVKIVCVTRHWFTLPIEQLPAAEPPRSTPAESGGGRGLGERARG